MFAAGAVYPLRPHPQDVMEAMNKDRESFFFVDVQARGAYPSYALQELKRKGWMPEMKPEDERILASYPVDFIAFSYYNSRCVSAQKESDTLAEGNLFVSAKNPYLSYSEWGWPIDPLGLRITLNQIYDRYLKPMFLVENGIGIDDQPNTKGVVEDDDRIAYLKAHIQAMKDAIELDGVDLMGFIQHGDLSI